MMNNDYFIQEIHELLETRRKSNKLEHKIREIITQTIKENIDKPLHLDIQFDTSMFMEEFIQIEIPYPGLCQKQSNMNLAILILHRLEVPADKANIFFDMNQKKLCLLIDVSNIITR